MERPVGAVLDAAIQTLLADTPMVVLTIDPAGAFALVEGAGLAPLELSAADPLGRREPGAGAAFTVRLPLAGPAPEAA
ncbi:hypothetical protein [Nannocystis punicea]|uniref:Uncharacterized protein n=1 Tax=Nannocystis punicea TaxID=2995304 RepID=A0ABY7GV06_9BACT|nr:hypothetical protein [Nannocystis poenicansa]WAS90808.1 hypothetical protein O0S08_31860 [Nannocystis poenicansa]